MLRADRDVLIGKSDDGVTRHFRPWRDSRMIEMNDVIIELEK